MRIKEHTFFNNLTNDSIVMDLGAMRGDFSNGILKKCKCKKIIAIEPDPNSFGRIKRTKKLKARNVFVGTEYGKRNFFVNPNDPHQGTGYEEMIQDKVEKIKVQSVKFESLLNEKLDLLKMDIEGAEWDIIPEITQEQADKINQITVEFHCFKDRSKFEQRTKKCKEHLKGLGYKVKIYNKYMDCLFHK